MESSFVIAELALVRASNLEPSVKTKVYDFFETLFVADTVQTCLYSFTLLKCNVRTPAKLLQLLTQTGPL